MGYTGYKVIQYIDDNPNSPTYGETWTELVLDTEHCPNGSGDWELVSSNCELSTSGYTGRRVYTYYNNVTNEYSSTTSADSSCKTSSLDEIWTNSGDSYCEVDEDGKYTGYGLQRQVQTNSNLINYKEIRDVRVTKTECLEELEPVWQDLYKVCHIEQNPGGTLYYDGTADILQIDINPSSESYNQTRTINVPDESCAVIECDSINEVWVFLDDYCGNQVPANYGLTNLSSDTVYHIYQQYQQCIVEGEVVRETPTNTYSAVTYQTGVYNCRYRWVDSEETVCIENLEGVKLRGTYSGGTTAEVLCDGDSSVGQLDVNQMPDYNSIVAFQIGTCVDEIENTGFGIYHNFSSITIPDTVTQIGQYAFHQCSALTSVYIPDGVTDIDSWTFAQCFALQSVHLPKNLTHIGIHAFTQCSGLTSIEIPNSVSGIGYAAFSQCSNITDVVIPNSVTWFDTWSIFGGCTKLSGVTLSNNLADLKNQTFEDCTSLSSITLPNSVTTLGNNTFRRTSLSSITFNNVTTIGSYTFDRCKLSSVTITDKITSIGNNPFMTNPTITSMTVNSNNSVYDSRNNCNAIIETATNKLISGCKTTVIPSSVEAFGQYAFSGMSISSVTIPNGVTEIPSGTFAGNSLRSITIPNSVTNLAYCAFYSCNSLTSVTLSNSISGIGESCFASCSFSSIDIPDSVSRLGLWSFGYNSNLRNVTIGTGITYISNYTLGYCINLESVTIKATTPPTMYNMFYNTNNTFMIYVPSASVDAYKAATNWSTYADRIMAIPNS